jgi:hypothetical protein
MRGARGAALAGIAALLVLSQPLRAADPAADYAFLLAKSVKDGGVDYGELASGRAALDAYVRWLATADPGATDALRMAFWINAYNALTLLHVLDAKDEPRASKVAGRDVTPSGIEEILLGFGEPLVLFALYRASRSSPPLSAVPYEGRDLPSALAQQTRSFLGDPEKNLFEYAQLRAELSMLLLWHSKELEAGRQGEVPPLQLFLADHLPAEQDVIARSLRTTAWRISFRPWDKSLDDAGADPHGAHPAWTVVYSAVAALLLFFGFRAFRALLRPPAPAPPHPPDG